MAAQVRVNERMKGVNQLKKKKHNKAKLKNKMESSTFMYVWNSQCYSERNHCEDDPQQQQSGNLLYQIEGL